MAIFLLLMIFLCKQSLLSNHSSILAWKISWTEEPGGLKSMGSQRVGHDWETNTYLLTLILCQALYWRLCCAGPSHSVMSDSLWPHGLQPSRPLCPWGFSRQEYWRGCHALLQGIFPTQGSNPGLPHCRRILYRLSHKGSPYWRLGIYKRWPLHNFNSLRIYSLEDKNDALWIRIVYYSLLLLQVTETNLSYLKPKKTNL